MCLDGRIAPTLVVSLNGALLPFRGLAAQHLRTDGAAVAASTPLLPRTVRLARPADPDMVRRLIRDTGSGSTASSSRRIDGWRAGPGMSPRRWR